MKLIARLRHLWRKYVVHLPFHWELYRAYRTKKKCLPEWGHTWQTFSAQALHLYRYAQREALFDREQASIHLRNWERVTWVSWLPSATWHPGCPHCKTQELGRWETLRFQSPTGQLSQTQMLVYHCLSCGRDSNGLPRYGWARLEDPDLPLPKSTRKQAEIVQFDD